MPLGFEGPPALGDHQLSGAGHLLEVVARSGGDPLIAEDELLGNAAAEGDCHGQLRMYPPPCLPTGHLPKSYGPTT